MPRIIDDSEIKEDTPTAKAPPRRAPRGDDRKLAENLAQLYSMIGGGVASWGMLRNDVALVATGNNIISKSEDIAGVWLELAEQNPMVKKFLAGFTEGSAVASLVGIHVVALAPFAASRGIVPEQMAMMMMTDEAREATANYVTQTQAKAAAAAGAAAGNGNGQH